MGTVPFPLALAFIVLAQLVGLAIGGWAAYRLGRLSADWHWPPYRKVK